MDRAARLTLRGVGIALLAAAGALYVLSTDLVASALLRRLEAALPAFSEAALPASPPPDYVVVLGGGTIMSSPAEGGHPALSSEAESRLVYGIRLARRLDLPLVVSGGTVFAQEGIEPEARVAARLAVELGFPEARITVEDRSRTTRENALFTAERVAPRRPVVVTSAYHMRRAMLAFERSGMTGAIAAPCAYRGDRRPLRAHMLLPSMGALDGSATAWREQIGYYWYRLRMARQLDR